ERCLGSATEDEAVDEIVDMHHMQLRRAAADHDEDAASDRAVELEKPQVPLSIRRAGTDDDDGLAASRRGAHGELALELGEMANVAGAERIGFARGRVYDVAMHAAGRAMHDPLTAEAAGGLEHVQCSARVDFPVVAVGVPCRPEHRGEVVDLVAAACGGQHVAERCQLSHAHVDAGGGKRLSLRGIPDQCAYLVALGGEPPGEVAAGKAGGAGDENGTCHGGVTDAPRFSPPMPKQRSCLVAAWAE